MMYDNGTWVSATSPDDLDVLFNDDYDYFEIPELDDERNGREATEIATLLNVGAGARILDAPCGHGRHANELASRGFDVVAVDRSHRFLNRAQRDATRLGVSVEYRRMDLREMQFDAEFDGAFCWYGSFGYFDDDTDLDILRRYRRALRTGGRLLIDMQSPYRLVPRLIAGGGTTAYVVHRGDDVAIDVIELDAIASRYSAERITIRGTQLNRSRYSVRLLTAPEVREWAVRAGFAGIEVLDETGAPLKVTSRRLVAVAIA